MTQPQVLILLVIALTLIFFVWEKWRYDFVALGAMFIGIFLGVIPKNEAFVGFGHPAVITVAAVLILSRALSNSGVTDLLAGFLDPLKENFYVYLIALSLVAMILSSFMNNVGALALLMPVAIQTAVKTGRSPSLILMPLAFSSVLGGLVTLIGTPPNIIISTFREQNLGEPFSMFDFTAVGLTVALGGVLFICLIGWRLIPKMRTSKRPLEDLLEIESYITEVEVLEGSTLLELSHARVTELTEKEEIDILGLIRHGQRFVKIPKNQNYLEGDILIVSADPENLALFAQKNRLSIKGVEDQQKDQAKDLKTDNEEELIEVVVGPRSSIAGRQVEDINFRRRYGVNLLGVSRQGHSYKGRLKAFSFMIGDVLLLNGTSERLSSLISTLGFMPLAERRLQMSGHKNLYRCLGIFFFAIGMTVLKIAPAPVALSIGALLMVLTRTLPIKDFYESIDWSIIVLLAAMIPISTAFEQTGAAHYLVNALVGTSGSTLSPIILLSLLLLITMLLTDVMNNAATSIIMAPIAVSIAKSLSVNPDSFLMAVAIGASCSFLTPIGHQNNALVLGPGGYKFGDYWRMGLPLEVIIAIIAVPMILLVWPLTPS